MTHLLGKYIKLSKYNYKRHNSFGDTRLIIYKSVCYNTDLAALL